MIPKKYIKYIAWVIVFLVTIWAMTTEQGNKILDVFKSFETSTWVTQ